jgi:hypothetical protein
MVGQRVLEGLRYQTAQLEAFVYNYKNNNKEYLKVIKSIEDKISDCLSDKKRLLQLAIFSLIHSMRSNPEKYSSLIYHNNDIQTSSIDKSNLVDMKRSREVILPPPPYDNYIIEDYKTIMLEEAEELYNVLIYKLVCEAVNENVSKQTAETIHHYLLRYH